MRAELERVKADTRDPLANDAGILTCSEATTVDAPGEQEFAGLPAGNSEILVNGLPRLLGQLETDRATGLLLADRCSIECVTLGATSSTPTATTSQPRNLLSMARLNSARSREIGRAHV